MLQEPVDLFFHEARLIDQFFKIKCKPQHLAGDVKHRPGSLRVLDLNRIERYFAQEAESVDSRLLCQAQEQSVEARDLAFIQELRRKIFELIEQAARGRGIPNIRLLIVVYGLRHSGE